MASTEAAGPAIQDINAYLDAHEKKDMLRFITCGSVDDGKSTLIGRLLFDSKLIFEDQIAALDAASRKYGTVGEDIDLALLVDGLQAEREQGITIDVAYRFFATDRRKFIVADTPGHEQYTRNMATGASTADLAVILVDARKGVLTQTRRHSYIVNLLGIRQVVLAVNKMDLIGYDQAGFQAIVADYQAFAADLGIAAVTAVPLSALKGDNVFHASEAMAWYTGPTLMEVLETASTANDLADQPFRMPVQWVNRPDHTFRGFSGLVVSGTVCPGDAVTVVPGDRRSTVTRVATADGDLPIAGPGQSITLVLADEIDVSRGAVIAEAGRAPEVTDQVSAHVIWMHDTPLLPHRHYLFKSGTQTTGGEITRIVHGVNVNTLEHSALPTLALNDIARCHLAFDRDLAIDPYTDNRDTGGFIIIDRYTNETVGAGMIDHGLRRATNIHWQETDVHKDGRAKLKGQRPVVLWFTGLSGSGKSTVASIVERKLHASGRHTYLLDGDNVRHGLNRDLGFTDQDRVENVRRVGEVAGLFVDAGMIVLVSFISPFRAERQLARDCVGGGEFVEVFMDTPLELCEARDPKGLYAKARSGALVNFTGIDSPYEAPEAAEIRLDGSGGLSAEALADQVVAFLTDKQYL